MRIIIARGTKLIMRVCSKDFLVSTNINALNENALSNVLVDVDFLEEELARIQRTHLCSAFAELRQVCDSIFSCHEFPLNIFLLAYIDHTTRYCPGLPSSGGATDFVSSC
jgi:hypothetical protein